MSFIIVLRNPRTGNLIAMMDEDSSGNERILERPTEETAERFAMSRPVCEAWGYQVLEVRE